jgi:rubrerythrin
MEADGETYYREQAALHQNNGVGVVSLILADAEQKHRQLLLHTLNHRTCELSDSSSYAAIKNVFSTIGDFRNDIKAVPGQLDFFRHALDIEKQSIDLYITLHNDTPDKTEKDVFEYLIDQENLHFSLLDAIVQMLRHAEEWVESAEFGLRNETY